MRQRLVSSSLDQHVDWIARYIELGFEEIHLHNVNRNQEPFLDAFGTKVYGGGPPPAVPITEVMTGVVRFLFCK